MGGEHAVYVYDGTSIFSFQSTAVATLSCHIYLAIAQHVLCHTVAA